MKLGTRVVMDLIRSQVKAKDSEKNYSYRVWVHTNGHNEQVIVSDMESKNPNGEDNGDKYNHISSIPKFLTSLNMLTLGRVISYPLLIVGESKPFVKIF